MGLPRWFNDKESACQCRRRGFDLWVQKILWDLLNGNGNPFQYFSLGNPLDRGTWQAVVHGDATESDTA